MPALEEQPPAKRPRTKASGSGGVGGETVDDRPRCGIMTRANRPCKRLVKTAGRCCPDHAAWEDPATAEMQAEEEKTERMVAEQKALEEELQEQEEKTAKLQAEAAEV